MINNRERKINVSQILYSGLGGHGSVALSMLEGENLHRWHNSLGFMGVESFLPNYRNFCVTWAVPHKYFRVIPGRPFLTWPNITAWLYRMQPDVILLHSVKAILPCLVYSLVCGKPIVFIEHQANALKKRSEWWVTRLGMLFSTKVVYLTENYAEEVRERVGRIYNPKKVEIIANGINTLKFHPAEKAILSCSTVTIGMAARFTSMRRQDILIEAIEKIQQLVPHLKWHLSLAGDGETHSSVQKMINHRGLQNHVTFTGHLGEKELIGWFQSLDIYVHASEGETLSTSMLQAMACGLPVVASNVPGIRNLLSGHGDFGCLVAQQDADGFAARIVELVSNVDITRKMGFAGRSIAQEKYSHKRMSSNYADLIKRLCN